MRSVLILCRKEKNEISDVTFGWGLSIKEDCFNNWQDKETGRANPHASPMLIPSN